MRQTPLAVVSVLLLSMASCRVHQAQDPESWTHNPFAELTEKQTTFAAVTDYLKITAPGYPLIPVLELDPAYCKGDSNTIHWRIPMHSQIGTHHLHVNYGDSVVFTHFSLLVEDRTLTAPLHTRPSQQFLQKACSSYTTHHLAVMVEADSSTLDAVRSWAESSSSDCTVAFDAEGISCRLPELTANAARDELQGIKATMIRRWSRQPYQLTRRLATALNLANAVTAEDSDRRIAAFCRVMRASQPVELPLALSVPRLQASICEPAAPWRDAAIRVALAKTVAEIDFLKQLFERTSKLGTISLRIPRDLVEENTIWVNLYPMDDVAGGLQAEAAKLWAEDAESEVEVSELPAACWHPLFGYRDETLFLSRYLGLTGDVSSVFCEPLAKPEASDMLSPTRYISESITSETEFVVTNYRGKILRLPRGTYTYTMQPLPKDPGSWDDAAAMGPQTSGTISWDSKKPQAVIRTW